MVKRLGAAEAFDYNDPLCASKIREYTHDALKLCWDTISLPATAKPRFIRIHVHKPAREGKKAKDVNIRIPMTVVRGGMRLGTIIPGWQQWMGSRVKDRGMDIDFSKLDPAALESMLNQMGEINIDNGNGEQVRITSSSKWTARGSRYTSASRSNTRTERPASASRFASVAPTGP